MTKCSIDGVSDIHCFAIESRIDDRSWLSGCTARTCEMSILRIASCGVQRSYFEHSLIDGRPDRDVFTLHLLQGSLDCLDRPELSITIGQDQCFIVGHGRFDGSMHSQLL